MNTTTAPKTLVLGRPGPLTRRSAFDWVFMALVVLGAAYAFQRYHAAMDGYEKGILLGAAPALIALGWFWGPLRLLGLGVGAATLLAISLYNRHTDGFGADLAQGENVFLLKYFISSQSAILWMGVLFAISTVMYWIGLLSKATTAGTTSVQNPGNDNTGLQLGSRMAWAGVFMALTGTLVRWFESHQIGPDIGHIPPSSCKNC